jgi:cytochrome c556
MVRKLIRASLFTALGSMAMILSFGAAVTTAQDKKDKKGDKKEDLPSISDIKAKTDGYLGVLRGQVKGGKWEDAAKTAKDFTLIADALAKNKPGKGDAKSWEALTKKYTENVKAIEAGVEKKDAAAANKALGAIGSSCKGCHDKHK